jgi:hypothetical protein
MDGSQDGNRKLAGIPEGPEGMPHKARDIVKKKGLINRNLVVKRFPRYFAQFQSYYFHGLIEISTRYILVVGRNKARGIPRQY